MKAATDSDLKSATLEVAIARPLGGRFLLLVMTMTGGGNDASRESDRPFRLLCGTHK
jgi:hypothetical protein